MKHISSSVYHVSPADHFRTFLLSVLKTESETTIGLWTPTRKTQLREILRCVFGDNTSSARSCCPGYPFWWGISSLTLVSVPKRFRLWFVILVSGRTVEGESIFKKNIESTFQQIKDGARQIIEKAKEEVSKTKAPDSTMNYIIYQDSLTSEHYWPKYLLGKYFHESCWGPHYLLYHCVPTIELNWSEAIEER